MEFVRTMFSISLSGAMLCGALVFATPQQDLKLQMAPFSTSSLGYCTDMACYY